MTADDLRRFRFVTVYTDHTRGFALTTDPALGAEFAGIRYDRAPGLSEWEVGFAVRVDPETGDVDASSIDAALTVMRERGQL